MKLGCGSQRGEACRLEAPEGKVRYLTNLVLDSTTWVRDLGEINDEWNEDLAASELDGMSVESRSFTQSYRVCMLVSPDKGPNAA